MIPFDENAKQKLLEGMIEIGIVDPECQNYLLKKFKSEWEYWNEYIEKRNRLCIKPANINISLHGAKCMAGIINLPV